MGLFINKGATLLQISQPDAKHSVVALYQSDGTIVAKVYLDHLKQVQSVILLPCATKEQRAFALRLAATSVCRYIVKRPGVQRIQDGAFDFNPSYSTTADSRRTYALMQSPVFLRGIEQMDTERLARNLQLAGVPVLDAAHATLEAALFAVLECIEPDRRQRIWFHGHDPKGLDDRGIVGVRFVSLERPFTVWRKDQPRHPEYPVSELRHLINGESSQLERHPTITVYPPHHGGQPPVHFSQLNQKSRRFIGNSLTLRIPATFALSGACPRLLADIIQTGLSLDNAHMAVQGGLSKRSWRKK